MKTKYVGFRIEDDIYKKIIKLKQDKTITHFFCEIIQDTFEAQKKGTEDYGATMERIEMVMQRLENTLNDSTKEYELTKKMEKILSLLEMTLQISVAIAASSPASTNTIRRKYPTLIEDTIGKR